MLLLFMVNSQHLICVSDDIFLSCNKKKGAFVDIKTHISLLGTGHLGVHIM